MEGDGSSGPIDFERQQREEAEMAKAMQEVERLRLEMQRASERIEAAKGVEGTVVKKKKKKPKVLEPEGEEDNSVFVAKKKKKKSAKVVIDGHLVDAEADSVVKPRKKKKKAKIDEAIVVRDATVD